MLDGVATYNNVNGTDSFDFNDTQSPLNLFDPQVQERTDTSRARMEQHGVNPTIPLRGGMEIHMEGDLFAGTGGAYATLRKAMVAALFGSPDDAINLTNRINGTLVLNVEGETETWQTDTVITMFSAPNRALYPSISEYAVTMFSWTPYFVGTDSGDKIYWS